LLWLLHLSTFSNAPSPSDIARITELLGRVPQGNFQVVVRTRSGDPVVLYNEPLLADGTPMPTRYWLVGEHETVQAGRLEAQGGVNTAEAEVNPVALAEAHARYAAERDASIAAEHTGPRPSGGVGGTRIGVKCLHAHLGWWLAGGNDPVGQWTADKLGTSRDNYVISAPRKLVTSALGAIDIGTNSTNLLICNPQGTELVREVHVTGLGRGLVQNNQLQAEAIERTMQRLRSYRALLDEHQCGIIRVTATEACRRATNAAEFLDQAEQALGIRPEVIGGEAEARLAYAGAISHFPPHEGITLVVDIGGGSTEVMIGDTQFRHAMSFPVGTVVLTETELHRDPPRPEELTNAIGRVTDFMDDLLREYPEVVDATRVIGVAGSIVTIASVEIGLAHFNSERLHGHVMSRSDIEEVFRTLATEKLADRKHNPGLPSDRADVIVGGCCVLVGIMRRLHLSEMMVSVHNLLDGVIAQELTAS
jgi:exopolyphosphatase/guanosine-5'-triphosphate,3'-diphosphate pyrophosphatase